jgi:hypothetical protein
VPLCSLTLAALASQLVAARLWPLDPDVAVGDVVPLLWTGGARQTAASCGEGVREGHTGTAVVDAPSCSPTSGDQRKAGIEVRLRRGGSVPARRRGSTTRPYPDLAAMWPYPRCYLLLSPVRPCGNKVTSFSCCPAHGTLAISQCDECEELGRPIYKTRRAPDGHPKLDGFGCQISFVGAGVKFNPTMFFCRSVFWST